MSRPVASIIVPNYNGGEDLLQCVKSLLNTSPKGTEIIIVDNGSRDGSLDLIKALLPERNIVSLKTNTGFAYACNLGAQQAESEILVFMNSDTVALKGWIEPLLEALNTEGVGACTPKLKMLKGSNILNSCGGICDRLGFGWNRGIGETDTGQYNSTGECFYAVGACLATRKSLFESLGGFDQDYFMYLEDLDYSWRLRLAGYGIRYVPTSTVLHRWMGSIKDRRLVRYLYHRNRLRTILKNYGFQKLHFLLPVYLTLQVALIAWLAAANDKIETANVTKAILWNMRHLKETLRARLRTQSSRRVLDKTIEKHMFKGLASIYFALGTLKHPLIRK